MAGVTRVKVCGLTRAEDIRLAMELGAWALGFVLAPSPRRVTIAQATHLIATARTQTVEKRSRYDRPASASAPHTVLVVTTESPEWIATALDESGADGVQLSAGGDGPLVADVRAAAARLRRRPLVVAAADTPDAHLADFVLLDARKTGAYGGTGETLDWEALAANPATPTHDLVLAGGLRPGNVREAVRLLQPHAVDVSSGVEAASGHKDHTALREFFAAVEQADRETASAGADGPAPATRRRTPG
jgi:phosphoribosylanthranilate isomerase